VSDLKKKGIGHREFSGGERVSGWSSTSRISIGISDYACPMYTTTYFNFTLQKNAANNGDYTREAGYVRIHGETEDLWSINKTRI
jgi:hypothetical protein